MKKTARILFILSYCLLAICAQAQLQGQARIDSLLKELAKAKYDDTNKINILNDLGYDNMNYNPDEGLKYGGQALALSEKLNYKNGIGWAYTALGGSYMTRSNSDKGRDYFLNAIKIFEETGNDLGIAKNLTNTAITYLRQSDYTNTLAYAEKALKANEKINRKIGIYYCLQLFAAAYANQSNYPIALEYLFKEIKICEELNDKNGIATVLKNIGIIYMQEQKHDEALEYFQKALKIAEELNNRPEIAGALIDIGHTYEIKNKYPEAINDYTKALKTYEELGIKDGISDAMGCIAGVYRNLNDYSQALKYLYAALKINREINSKNGIAFALDCIGEIYLIVAEKESQKYRHDSLVPYGKAANLNKAIKYLNESIALSAEIKTLDYLQRAANMLSEAYAMSGDYRNAYKFHQLYTTTKDSVFSTENNVKITNLETQRAISLKQKDIEIRDKQIQIDKLAVAKKRNERGYFMAGIGLLIVVCTTIFKSYKTQRKSNTLLTKTNGLLTMEKKRSDDLLLNILPSEVADELKDKGSADAKYFEDVTVLFTDFIDFTKTSERLTPQQLVNELDTCFKAFDGIMGKYGIEKIKTVGDAYLAVSGLPLASPRHAEHVVSAAIEIREFMLERRKQLDEMTFEIRMGIHSGSVVAGIVGVKKFAYDIWGDTVNTAARMEQNSEAGRINISQTTYELVHDRFICGYRGEIEAKNKGELKMYYVAAEATKEVV